MMFRSTLHNHCTLCDGKSTPAEMVEAALSAGFTDMGFSCHGYAPFDIEYSIRSEQGYVDEIRRLKLEYEGRINIYCGVEDDYYCTCSDELYDYRIGALHYIRDEACGKYHIIDGSTEDLAACRNEMFAGDGLAMAEEYYRLLGEHISRSKPDIAAHLDVITKCNGNGVFFDTSSARYRLAVENCLEKCIRSGALFEINTGAIPRGYKDTPYPEPFIMDMLREMGARLVFSADCHDASMINFGFDLAADYAREHGFRTFWELIGGTWEEVEL